MFFCLSSSSPCEPVCLNPSNLAHLCGRRSHEVIIADHSGHTYRVVFATWQNGQFALQRVSHDARDRFVLKEWLPALVHCHFMLPAQPTTRSMATGQNTQPEANGLAGAASPDGTRCT